jgi:hypothetical protein
MRQAGMFGLSDHLKRLSAHGDPLEELGQISSTSRLCPCGDAQGSRAGCAEQCFRCTDVRGISRLTPA